MGYHSNRVSTTKAGKFDSREEGNTHFVTAANVSRTFTTHDGAIDHATNLITELGGCEDYLIVKVVGRVRKKIPIEYIEVVS